MVTVTNDATAFVDVAAVVPSQRKGLLKHILHALHKSQECTARRAIIKYADLLPEGVKPADVMPFISSDQT